MLQKTRVIAMFMAFIGLSLIYSCNNSEDDVTPDKVAMITGKWFLNSESFTMKDGNGTVLETDSYTYTENLVSLEFNADGSFQYLDLPEVSWDKGTYTFDSETSNFTFVTDEETLTGTVTVTESSLQIAIAGSFEDDGETFTQEINLAGTKAPVPDALINEGDFSGNKWSISSQNTTVSIDTDNDDLPDLTFSEAIPNIPYNQNTVTFNQDGSFMYIDAFWEGDFFDDATWEFIDATNIYIDDQEEDAILHLNSISDGLYSFTIFSNGYEEIDGDFYDFYIQQLLTAKPNDGTEATITENQFFGSWEITGFVEKEEGQDVTGNDSPAGATLNFNQDGTGSITFDGEPLEDISDVRYIDGSDFCFKMHHSENDIELILMTLTDFDETNNVIEVSRGYLTEDANGDDVHKQEIITLAKQ